MFFRRKPPTENHPGENHPAERQFAPVLIFDPEDPYDYKGEVSTLFQWHKETGCWYFTGGDEVWSRMKEYLLSKEWCPQTSTNPDKSSRVTITRLPRDGSPEFYGNAPLYSDAFCYAVGAFFQAEERNYDQATEAEVLRFLYPPKPKLGVPAEHHIGGGRVTPTTL